MTIEFLDTDQVAKMLHCEVSTIAGLACRGELPATKLGKGYLFVADDVVAFVRSKIASDTAERLAKRNPERIMAVALNRTSQGPGRRRTQLPDLPGLRRAA